jgi:hypothetical protein
MQGGGTAVIAGATKSLEINCRLVNGAYDLTGELYNGRVLFRKRGDDSLCLRFTKGCHWVVSPVANKDANDDLGYATRTCSDQDQHLPPVSGWGVSDGKAIVADEGITVTLSDALKSMVRSICCSVVVRIIGPHVFPKSEHTRYQVALAK